MKLDNEHKMLMATKAHMATLTLSLTLSYP